MTGFDPPTELEAILTNQPFNNVHVPYSPFFHKCLGRPVNPCDVVDEPEPGQSA